MGILIAFTFLLPDVMRGFAFLRKGYFLIGLVHAFVGLFGMLTTSLYAAVTASNDIAVLTNVSVLLPGLNWLAAVSPSSSWERARQSALTDYLSCCFHFSRSSSCYSFWISTKR
jgi:hypothetical protein